MTSPYPVGAMHVAKTHSELFEYLRALVIWNAITIAVTMFVSGMDGFPFQWLVGVIIATITGSFCYWGAVLVGWVERRALTRLDRPLPEHGNMWRFSLGVLLMPAGLWLSFHGLVAIFPTVNMPDFSGYRRGVLFGVGIAAIFFLADTVASLRKSEEQAQLRTQRAETERLRAQLSALTAQMNPHFLFNALNTIAALIHERPDDAEDATVELAELLRGVLAASRQSTHSLGQEIAICRAYLGIEARRFGERLDASIDVDEALLSTPVPTLIVQPLIENAVKYAVSPRISGGRVALRGWRGEDDALHLSVEDDGPGMNASTAPAGAGVGLDSCRSRLALHYGDRATLTIAARAEGSGTGVGLKIPLE